MRWLMEIELSTEVWYVVSAMRGLVMFMCIRGGAYLTKKYYNSSLNLEVVGYYLLALVIAFSLVVDHFEIVVLTSRKTVYLLLRDVAVLLILIGAMMRRKAGKKPRDVP